MQHMHAEQRSKRTLVVGDIHGRADKLDTLLERLKPDPDQDQLIFLGDYLDRGPQSRQVLDILLGVARTHPRAVFLVGNHEAALLQYETSQDPEDLRRLRRLGFEATLESYAALPGLGIGFMPPGHRDFLRGLKRVWRSRELVCFHAPLAHGVEPEHVGGPALEDLFSRRKIEPEGWEASGQTLVFGHVPFRTPLVVPGLIGIDTGSGRGGMLTALEWPGLRFHQA
jgi:serine/threonine protein phosphatase 1